MTENLEFQQSNEEVERKKIEKLCEGEPDVLCVLSGSVVKRELSSGTDAYKSGSYADLDVAHLLNGGKARVISAAEINRFYPDVQVIANGNTYENAPSDASVMKRELEARGVPADHILLQEKSYSTFTEFIELVKYVAMNKWKHIVIVTNEFQIPRAKELLEQISTLRDPKGAYKDPDFQAALPIFLELAPKIVFVSAEEILPLRDPRYQKIVDEAKASEEWRRRVENETKGLKQLQEGTYWKDLPPQEHKPFRL